MTGALFLRVATFILYAALEMARQVSRRVIVAARFVNLIAMNEIPAAEILPFVGLAHSYFVPTAHVAQHGTRNRVGKFARASSESFIHLREGEICGFLGCAFDDANQV